jgi:DNA-binding beta-propeller fold protein YncE
MDEQRFDAALRALGNGASRRQALAGAIGALFGGGLLETAAKGKDTGKARSQEKEKDKDESGAEGPCGDGSGKANRCRKHSQCCTGYCKKKKGRSGRCRCLKRGKACTADKNCCKGMTCRDGVCSRGSGPKPPVCDATTCPSGCCDGTTCLDGTSNSACGTGGGACVTCSSLAPFCTAGICQPGTGWVYSTKFGSDGSGDDQFSYPYGVTVSLDGLTAWVADWYNYRVTVWTRPDITSTTWSYNAQFGTQGSAADQFQAVWNVVVTADTLTVFAVDYDNNRVSVWTRPNATSTAWTHSVNIGSSGSGDDQFDTPYGLTISPDGLTLFVADSGNDRISVWTRPDTASTSWTHQTNFGTSGSGDDQLDQPEGLSLSPDLLTLWIADANNARISIWTRPNATSTAWTHLANFGSLGSGDDNFDYPEDVSLSADTLTALIADNGNSRVCVWTRPDVTSTVWSYSAQFGSYGSGETEIDGAHNVDLSADGLTAYLADSGNSRIVIWKYV